jgi:hypothetical protein
MHEEIWSAAATEAAGKDITIASDKSGFVSPFPLVRLEWLVVARSERATTLHKALMHTRCIQ